MRSQFEEIKMEWDSMGFDRLLLIPIDTFLTFLGADRHIIRHKGLPMIWVNGDSKNLPFVFLPAKSNGTIGMDIAHWDISGFTLLLEYLSLISLNYPNDCVDISHQGFKNMMSLVVYVDVIETQKPYFPRCFPDAQIDKMEFQNADQMTEVEYVQAAYFRDGMSNKNLFYSYVSFFQILEMVFPQKGKKWDDLIIWLEMNLGARIDSSLSNIKSVWLYKFMRGTDEWDIFLGLFAESGEKSIGLYLINQIRNAVVHPVLRNESEKSPTNFRDYYELYYANQFVKSASYFYMVNDK